MGDTGRGGAGPAAHGALGASWRAQWAEGRGQARSCPVRGLGRHPRSEGSLKPAWLTNAQRTGAAWRGHGPQTEVEAVFEVWLSSCFLGGFPPHLRIGFLKINFRRGRGGRWREGGRERDMAVRNIDQLPPAGSPTSDRSPTHLRPHTCPDGNRHPHLWCMGWLSNQ